MTRFKKIMNRVHAILTTGKSAAAGVGNVLTAAGAGLAVSMGASNAVVVSIIALGVALTEFSVWTIPYQPFEV